MYFDIGANVGKWSIANLRNCDTIISIEASTLTFNRLQTNTKIYPNIKCLNYAVCDSNEEYVSFYISNADTLSTLNEQWLNSETSRFYKYGTYQETKCKTIKLDTLIHTYGVPDLIKIDVEGGEFEVVKSLTKKVNNICFEWAAETNNITFDCIKYLINLGYDNFALQFKDDYLYRPTEYTTANNIIERLKSTTPKKDWGMIWVK